MKKTFKYMLAAFAVVTAASCSQELENPDAIPQEDVELVPMTITVGGETKTTVGDDDKSLNWCEDDVIAVFDKTGTAREFKIAEGSCNGKIATFEGLVAAGSTDFTAVYPYSAAVSVSSEGVITATAADAQVLDGGNLADGATLSVAQFKKNDAAFTFRTAIGYLRVDVDKDDVTSIIVNGANVAGQATFNAAGELQEVVAGKSQVTLTPAGETFAKGSYYVTLLPGTTPANQFDITFVRTATTGAVMTATREVTIPRNAGFFVAETKLTESFLIKDAASLKTFLSKAPEYTTGQLATIVNDIDLTGETITSASSFKGTLDGRGHSIKNWTSNATALFTTYSGTVKNLVLDSSCKLTPPTGNGKFGFITKEVGSYGVMENCVNNASINFATTTIAQVYLGTLVGVSYGTIKNCVNNGKINISVSGNVTANCALGGLAGYVNTNTQFTNKGEAYAYAFIDCKNTGDITYTVNGTVKNLILGGVAGGTSYGSIKAAVFKGKAKGCINTGNISYTFKNGGELTNGNAGSGNYNNVGGVFGYWEGSIENCVNGVATDNTRAKVSLVSPTSTSVATSTRQAVGGVVSFVLHNVTSCTNYGQVNLVCSSQTGGAESNGTGIQGYPSAGGVVAQVGSVEEDGQSKYKVSDCHNYGALDFQMWMGSGIITNYLMGGVIGYSKVAVENCSNNGQMNVYTMVQTGYLGGVAGYLDYTATGLSNAGKLDFTFERVVDASKQLAGNVTAGGITGRTAISLTDCTNKGDMTVTIKSSDLTHAQAKFGGVAGDKTTGVFDRVYNEGNITINQNAKPSVVFGGVAGWLTGSIEVTDAKNSGNLALNTKESTDKHWCGGVFGYMDSNVKISGCVNEGAVSVNVNNTNSQCFIGGVLGNANAAGKTFTNCENSGQLTFNLPETTQTGFFYLGGLVGANTGHTYVNCKNTGDINYEGVGKIRLGGLVPYTNTSFAGTVKCNITAKCTGYNFSEVGGVVGYHSGSPVDNTTFEGTINTSGSTKKVYTGGIVGKTAGSGQKYNGCKFSGSLIGATGNNVPGLYSGGLQNDKTTNVFGNTTKCVVGKGSSINGAVVTELTKENLVSQTSDSGTYVSNATLTNIVIE